METKEAIQMLLSHVSMHGLFKATRELLKTQQKNNALLLLNTVFRIPTDIHRAWFTALGVICTHQKITSGRLFDLAAKYSRKPPLSDKIKTQLIKAIATTAKLTKADAG